MNRHAQRCTLNGKARVHLWVFNNPMHGISDQIALTTAAFEAQGYQVTCGVKPDPVALNILVENFDPGSRKIVQNFCQAHGKRVGVIMTEHIDFLDGELHFHGKKLGFTNDYMDPNAQFSRLTVLMSMRDIVSVFFVLGDLPTLENFSSLVSGANVAHIPFPTLEWVDPDTHTPDQDFLFTGVKTSYRADLMDKMHCQGLHVTHPSNFVDHDARDALNKRTRIILNLPQRADWVWLSSMRIWSALRCGRATISLGTSDDCAMARVCQQVQLSDPDWPEEVRHYCETWHSTYEIQFRAYQTLVADFEQQHPFPVQAMRLWSILDRLDY